MVTSSDIQRVLVALRDGLDELGLDFQDCGVNRVTPGQQVEAATINSVGHSADHVSLEQAFGGDLIAEFWRQGTPAYRPDLWTDDPYQECEGLRSNFDHPVRCILDVPFSHGTLAVNSDRPHAFSAADRAAIEGLAAVLSEAFRRRDDLIELETRQRHLEGEVAERAAAQAAALQAQEELRQALERERVLGHMRDRLLSIDDLAALAPVLENEWLTDLRSLGIPVYRASLQTPREGPGDYDIFWSLLPGANTAPEDAGDLRAYPWVRQAWDSGQPVIVDHLQLAACGFWDPRVHTVIEVPLPGGASLGISSEQDNAFGPAAVSALQTFAGLLATALQRLRGRRELQDSEERYRRLFETMAQGVVYHEPDGQIISANPAAERILGLSLDQLRGRAPVDPRWTGVRPDGTPMGRHQHPAMEAIRTGRRMEDAVMGISHPERPEVTWIRVTAIPFGATAANPPRGVFATFADITEQERLQRVVEEQRVRAVQVDRLHALGEMSTGIAHELNQPLTGIRTFAEGMLLGPGMGWTPSADEMRQAFRDIVVQVDRISEIIDHMRVFSRGDDTRPAMAFTLDEAVAGAMKLVGTQLRVHGIVVREELRPGLPTCRGWPHAIEQVVLNLLSNARDALDERRAARRRQAGPLPAWTPTLTIRTRAADEPGAVCLEVEDAGGGMPAEVAERAFEPFFTTKEPGRGTGIGLAIVRAIAERHRGTVSRDNRPGDGACFRMTLPVDRGTPISAPHPAHTP
jgi:PAS domain S-box-containing protein